MFLKWQSLLYGLVFLLGMELIVFGHRYVISIVFFLFIISTYQGKKVGGRWNFSILPSFFTLSSVALLYLITLNYEQQAFILLASLMYYLSLFGAYRLNKYAGDQTARGMNMAATVSTVFFTYAGMYGLYLNFLIPLWWLMLIFSIMTLLISYQYFSVLYYSLTTIKTTTLAKKNIWLYSFLMALIMSEITWTISFWPFGYLTTGAIILILYYIIWDIIQSHFLNNLTRKKVVFNLIFFFLAITTILVSSPWMPII